MANNITGASLSDIYSQLSGVSSYHPFDADTFADWSLEAGDIITVKRGTTEYASPVTQTRMSWKGTPSMTVSSTGNEKREPIAKVSKRKYSRGSGGMRNQQGLYLDFYSSDGYFRSVLSMTASDLQINFDNSLSSLHSELLMTAESIHAELENEASSLRGQIDLTAGSLRTAFDDLSSSLHSEITQTASDLRVDFDNLSSSLHSEITDTAESLRIQFENEASSLRNDILITASEIRAELEDESSSLRTVISETASGLEGMFTDGMSSMSARISATASDIRAELEAESSSLHTYIDATASGLSVDITNGLSGLNTRITAQAGSISTIITGMNNISSRVEQTDSAWRASVEGVASNGKVTAASIAAAINGDSTVSISASRIYLLGQTIADAVDADFISTRIASLSSLNVASISCSGTIGAGEIQADEIKFRNSGGAGYTFTKLKDLFVTSVAISGPVNNVYTLKYYFANDSQGRSGGSFSRATSLSGEWSGNTYTVTATPQGNSIHTNTFVSLPEWDIMNNKATVDFYYFDNNNISTRILPATININSKLLNKTDNNKFERNGTYNAHSAGYIGYGEIVIDVPQGIESSNIRTKFSGAPGSYYIEAVDNQTSTPISGTTTQYNLGARSQYVEIQTTSGARMPGGAYVTLGLNRGTITSSGTRDVTVTVDGVDTIVSQHFTDYSDGYAGAHLSGHWGTGANNYNVWTVEKVSTGNANGISTTITSGLSDFTYNPSTHKYSVTAYAYADDVQKYSMVGATGTEAYDYGFSAVKIAVTKTGNVYNIAKSTAGVYSSKLTVTTAPPDFNYNTSGHYFEVTGRAIVNGSTVSTATRNTSTAAYTAGLSDARLYGSWDANKYTVTKVSNGSLSASITVTAGTPTATYNSATHAYDITGTAYAGGECRHMATVSTGSGAYDAGWSAVRLSGTWSGNKYTVKKGNSGNTTDSITVLASTGFNYNTSQHYFEIEGNAIVGSEAVSTARSNTSTAAWTAGVTEGYSGAHLYGHWGTGANNYNVWTVEKVSTGTANAISVTVTSGLSSFTYHSDTHKYSVTAYAYGNSDQKHSMSGYTGTEAYEAGFSAVRLSSSWSGNKWTVKKGTDGSPSDAEITVTAGSPTATYNSANHCYDMVGTAWALGACRHKATNSTDTSAYTDGYSVGMRESTGGYASGWRECYSTVRLDSTEEKTLGYGSSIRVYAQAKTSSTAQTYTNIESRVIKAPNDRVCSLHIGSWESGKKKVDLIIDGTTASTQYAVISAMTDSWNSDLSPTPDRYKITSGAGTSNAVLTAGINVTCCGYTASFKVDTAVTKAYNNGYTAGFASVRISPAWTKATSTSTYNNKLTVTTTTDSSKSTSYDYTITAGLASLTYDSATHKYSTTGYAYAGGVVRDTKEGTSGDEAYQAGVDAGVGTLTWDIGSWDNGSKSVAVKVGNEVKKSTTVYIEQFYDEWDPDKSPAGQRFKYTANAGQRNAKLEAGIIAYCCGQSKKWGINAAAQDAYDAGFTAGLSGAIANDDIQIGPYNNVSTQPDGTDADLMKETILAAIRNGNWFRFKVYVKDTNAVKYYRMKFTKNSLYP